MMDLNNIPGKPVFVQIQRYAAEGDGQRDQHQLLPRHKREGLTLAQARLFERNSGKAGIGIQRAY
jgi:hypothetical protein